MTSKRSDRFLEFADIVSHHIDSYTVKQYGDYPNDQLVLYSYADCVKQILKYVNRADRGARGEVEQLRDMCKAAHYASEAFWKLLADISVNSPNTQGTQTLMIRKIMEGK